LLSLLVPATLPAQSELPTSADVIAQVQHLVVDLETSAVQKDWEAVRPHLPSDGAMTARIQEVVTGRQGGTGLSFWASDAVPDFTRLVVTPFASDLVAISVPFTQAGSQGTFGAVFEQKAGTWQLRCFQEAFGFRPSGPGCGPSDGPS
jgi:hypothetical protein